MWLSDKWTDYELIDCSGGEKLERWGKYMLVRPDPQAIWDTAKNHPAGQSPMRAMPARRPAAANGKKAGCRKAGRYGMVNFCSM